MPTETRMPTDPTATVVDGRHIYVIDLDPINEGNVRRFFRRAIESVAAGDASLDEEVRAAAEDYERRVAENRPYEDAVDIAELRQEFLERYRDRIDDVVRQHAAGELPPADPPDLLERRLERRARDTDD